MSIVLIAAIGGIPIMMGITVISWGIGKYNTMINAELTAYSQWHNILTEYQRRVDLFLNLAKNVKSFKDHERQTLIEVTKARQNLDKSKNQEVQAKAIKTIDAVLPRFNMLIEKYPMLKAGEQHTKFMEEIRITEDRINIARTEYNALARDYNILIKEFPASIIAKTFNFKMMQFYNNEENSQKCPEVVL